MGRTLRFAPADGSFHVTTRGNRRQIVFADDADRSWFIALLSEVVLRFEWNCLAYCLMTNHYHLVVHTPKETLSAGMQRLNGLFAQRFNWRHGYEGHLFERPFGSNTARDDGALQEFVRYTLLNPVRAGVAKTAGEWPWSSYAAAAGHVPAPRLLAAERLHSLFEAGGGNGRARFIEFVAAGRTVPSSHLPGPGPETWPAGPRGRRRQPSKRRTTMQALWPPKPNEFEQATSRSGASRASFGT